ncbi:MAG: bifunctional (p)ppGpp synthetase/guanosine-3',5'-bis(diphosphate) 3'-pyrophosphohydrolase [Prolixibacteraceae bacterium]|nr:bifunctional (p)ppGpp synthetase/guanosine-3',5'-bis(diphosphate) 3'-pyrophosphohydrolase [Prolixibacteraceae bacterium]
MALQSELEKRQIQEAFEDLLKSCRHTLTEENLQTIHKAFDFSNKAHEGVRRKSGEPYIMHPLAVATIVTKEIGLGTKSIVSSILHDVVEDTDYTLDDIKSMFGEKIASIVDGLTKLEGEFDFKQAANFRKMLLTLSDDVRVILIKIADRLHNMRTLDSMSQNKQLKISGETLYIYAPLAHRLGLYAIKTELEDLSLKYKFPDQYNDISLQLRNKEEHRQYLVEQFIKPIEEKLNKENLSYSIKGRQKSVYSIWKKMQIKKVSFDEVYDLLAIRIIFSGTEQMDERRKCWEIFSVITSIYNYKQDRIRDWITIPKANGYEALHVTVMGPEGKWVEVQIRSERMNEIAERGFAAHWKYKGELAHDSELDKWIERIKETLQNPESDVLEFLDDFKLNLFSSEIVVFTPKGEMKTLPKGSTVLDFAYEIHTDLGNKCIGAKINHQLVPFSHEIKSGDQIEILTSEKQKPQSHWFEIVITAKAKQKVKDAFKLEHSQHIDKGKQLIEEALKNENLVPSNETINTLLKNFNLESKIQMYGQIGSGLISLENIGQLFKQQKETNKLVKYWKLSLGKKKKTNLENNGNLSFDKRKPYILSEENIEKNFLLAKCCNPIPGDDVIGYLDTHNLIIIHKKSCTEASKMLASEGDRVITAKWKQFKILSYLSQIIIKGFDRIGIVTEITGIISKDHNVNMRTVHFDASEGVFSGKLDLYVHNTNDIENIISKLNKVKGVESVERVK